VAGGSPVGGPPWSARPDQGCQKVTQRVTLTDASQIVVRGVPILKIGAIIAPGNAGEHCWHCWHATCFDPPAQGARLAHPVRRSGNGPVPYLYFYL